MLTTIDRCYLCECQMTSTHDLGLFFISHELACQQDGTPIHHTLSQAQLTQYKFSWDGLVDEEQLRGPPIPHPLISILVPLWFWVMGKDLIVTRPLIAHLSLYTRLKPTCDKKIGIKGLLYIFNQWAFNCQARGPRIKRGDLLIFKFFFHFLTLTKKWSKY